MTQPLGGAQGRGEQLEPQSPGCPGQVHWGVWAGQGHELVTRSQAALLAGLQCLLPCGRYCLSFHFSLFSKISRFFANGNFRNVNDGLFLPLICTSFVWYSRHTILSHIYPTFCAVFLLLSSTTKPPCCSMKTCTQMCRLSWATFLDFNCMAQRQRKRILGLSEPLSTRCNHSQLLWGQKEDFLVQA